MICRFFCPMTDQSFPKQMRLRTRGEFRQVYERRCSVGDDLLRLVGDLSELPHPRLGLSVSRQFGNAFARNRWKRLLREAFRLSREKLPPGLDFIVIPRAPANRNCGRCKNQWSILPGACESDFKKRNQPLNRMNEKYLITQSRRGAKIKKGKCSTLRRLLPAASAKW